MIDVIITVRGILSVKVLLNHTVIVYYVKAILAVSRHYPNDSFNLTLFKIWVFLPHVLLISVVIYGEYQLTISLFIFSKA